MGDEDPEIAGFQTAENIGSQPWEMGEELESRTVGQQFPQIGERAFRAAFGFKFSQDFGCPFRAGKPDLRAEGSLFSTKYFPQVSGIGRSAEMPLIDSFQQVENKRGIRLPESPGLAALLNQPMDLRLMF